MAGIFQKKVLQPVNIIRPSAEAFIYILYQLHLLVVIIYYLA